MNRLVRAELFKLRTTNAWWLFALATLLSAAVMVVVGCVSAHSLLKPFADYVALESHGHAANLPPEFLARLQSEWALGHSPVTQAAAIYTAGQLPGVLLACLLGVVLVTSEFHHHTATTTFLVTPRRTAVVSAKLHYLLGRDPDCLTTASLLARVPDLAERDVYLCGPPRMADAVRSALLQAGLPAERLHEERFAF